MLPRRLVAVGLALLVGAVGACAAQPDDDGAASADAITGEPAGKGKFCGGALNGQIKDGRGATTKIASQIKPLRGATVTARLGSASSVATTDQSGNYSLSIGSGSCDVLASVEVTVPDGADAGPGGGGVARNDRVLLDSKQPTRYNWVLLAGRDGSLSLEQF